MKICLLCQYPVFSKNLCKAHWTQKFGKPLKRTRIKRVSDKKKNQDEEYLQICQELDDEAQDKKKWVCFFCDKKLADTCDHHHVAGKVGSSDNDIPLYLDKENIVLCHRSCHRKHHDITIEELLKTPYYDALLKKIHYICKARYFSMKIKHDRIQDT